MSDKSVSNYGTKYVIYAGGNRVTIYSFHTEDNLTNFRPTKQLKRRQTKSTTNITLLQV